MSSFPLGRGAGGGKRKRIGKGFEPGFSACRGGLRDVFGNLHLATVERAELEEAHDDPTVLERLRTA